MTRIMATNDFRSRYFPYCIEKTPGGKWVVLNRYYKPLGMTNTRDRVDYEPFGADFVGFGPATQTQIDCQGRDPSTTGDRVWLYNDATLPTDGAANMAAYARRLSLLAKLKVKV